jgi:ABC-type methionine transport system ATPase subunit
MVIVTHEIGFAREVADNVILLEGGKIVASGGRRKACWMKRRTSGPPFLSTVLQRYSLTFPKQHLQAVADCRGFPPAQCHDFVRCASVKSGKQAQFRRQIKRDRQTLLPVKRRCSILPSRKNTVT